MEKTTADSAIAVPGLHLVPTGPFVFVEGRRQGRVGPWESSELFEFRVEGESNPATPGEDSP